jgi:CDP-diacylglycerol--serine O-phosphatidyltransferase
MSEVEREAVSTPPRQGIRRGIYIIPSIFTIGNILCGFYAVINGVKGAQAQVLGDQQLATNLFNQAAIAICISWLLDNLDGRIARLTNTTSEFGVELDSIADFLSFGIAPAVLAYTWGYGATAGLEKLAWAVSFFFLICGALRLARFNVMARTSSDVFTGKTTKMDKRFFVGLPTPGAAGLVAGLIHFYPTPFQTLDAETRYLFSCLLLTIMALMALLMVSTIRYSKYVNIGAKVRHPFITLPLISLFAAGIWFYSKWLMLALAGTYVIHGPLLKIFGFLNRFRRTPREDSGSLE